MMKTREALVLDLITDLYGQVAQLQQENDALRGLIARLQQEAGADPEPAPPAP